MNPETVNPQQRPAEVREFERYRCRIDATFAVAPGNSEKTAFSRHTGDGSGFVRGVIVDCSHGGFAVETGTFLPRNARARVLVPVANDSPVELDVSVKRASMIGRAPLYNLGLSITEPVAGQQAAVNRLLALARAAQSPTPGQPTATQAGGGAMSA